MAKISKSFKYLDKMTNLLLKGKAGLKKSSDLDPDEISKNEDELDDDQQPDDDQEGFDKSDIEDEPDKSDDDEFDKSDDEDDFHKSENDPDEYENEADKSDDDDGLEEILDELENEVDEQESEKEIEVNIYKSLMNSKELKKSLKDSDKKAYARMLAKSLARVQIRNSREQRLLREQNGMLAKSLYALMKQNAFMTLEFKKERRQNQSMQKSIKKELGVLRKSMHSAAKTKNPKASISSMNVYDRNFKKSVGGNDSLKDLSKSEIMTILDNEFMSGNSIVKTEDVIAFESGSNLRPEVATMIASKYQK